MAVEILDSGREGPHAFQITRTSDGICWRYWQSNGNFAGHIGPFDCIASATAAARKALFVAPVQEDEPAADLFGACL